MTQRSPKLFVDDIIESIEKIEKYTKGVEYDSFRSDDKTVDAVVRNLEVIGEAAKNIPAEVRQKHPEIPWKNMIGLRNITIHEYFGIDFSIIWEIITKNIPENKPKIKKLQQKITYSTLTGGVRERKH